MFVVAACGEAVGESRAPETVRAGRPQGKARSGLLAASGKDDYPLPVASGRERPCRLTVSSHSFDSQIFRAKVSNPISKYIGLCVRP